MSNIANPGGSPGRLWPFNAKDDERKAHETKTQATSDAYWRTKVYDYHTTPKRRNNLFLANHIITTCLLAFGFVMKVLDLIVTIP